MSAADVDLLKDQVSRLTGALSRYQEAYPNFVLQEYGVDEDKSRSIQLWLSETKQMSPLLREYDATIYGLQEQLDLMQDEFNRLKNKAESLVQENEDLREQLKEAVHQQITSPPQATTDTGSGGTGGGDAVPETSVLQNLQQQVEIAVQEKEAAQEKWREAAQEVDRLEAELEMEKDSHQWRVVEQQAHQVKDQYQQSVTALNGEVDTLQTELRDLRTENSNLSQKVANLKLTVSELQQQLIWKDQEHADVIFKEGMSDSKVTELKRIMDDLRQRLIAVTKDGDEMRRENNTLHTRVTELQRRLSDTEVRENEAVAQVREAVQMVEASVMEKDQMEMLARQKEEETEELKLTMSKLINKAGARTREEVDVVRKQCNERISQLTEEVHALEMEGIEKQARLDRLLREKRAVESELNKIYKEGMLDSSKSKEAYQQLNKRAIDGERARDEANVKIDNLQIELDKLKLDNQQLKEQMESETKQLRERLTNVQSEFEVVSEERESSINKINELSKKLLAANKEKEDAHRKFVKELALIEQDQHVKIRDYEIRLQTTEDTRQQTVSELRKLLNVQQRMSARWKEECQTITHKFENKLKENREEMAHIKRRNEELTSLLKDSQAKTGQVERMLSEYTRNVRRMEERVREAEEQAGEAAKKLMRQSIRERQMAVERENLLTEMTRSQRGKSGLTGSLKDGGGLENSQKGDLLTLDQLSSSTKLRTSTGLDGGR